MKSFRVYNPQENRSNLIPVVGNIKIISQTKNIEIGRIGPTGSSYTEYGYLQNFLISMGSVSITPSDTRLNIKSIVNNTDIVLPSNCTIYGVNFCSNCTYVNEGGIVLSIGNDTLPLFNLSDYDQKYTEYKMFTPFLPFVVSNGGVISVSTSYNDLVDGQMFFDIFYK